MKSIRIISVGGLARLAPVQLEQKLSNEGFVFVDKEFVSKHQASIAKICRKRAKKNKPRYFITGKAGSIGNKPDEPIWYQALRVQKVRLGFHTEFAYFETVAENDLLIFNSESVEVENEHISVTIAQS